MAQEIARAGSGILSKNIGKLDMLVPGRKVEHGILFYHGNCRFRKTTRVQRTGCRGKRKRIGGSYRACLKYRYSCPEEDGGWGVLQLRRTLGFRYIRVCGVFDQYIRVCGVINFRWDFRKYLMAASRTNRMCGECSVFRVCGVPMANSYFTGPGGTGYARGKCVSGKRFGYYGNRPG
jgi:hypothetical protein